MRRLTAIIFLLVMVFNLYGYRLVISYVETSNAVAIENKVDNREYSDDELIAVKTVLHLPYYTSSPEFERAYGSISINGVAYEYVKKRVYKDTLELLCLPNHAKAQVQQAVNKLMQGVADGQTDVPSHKGAPIKIVLPDFCNTTPYLAMSILPERKNSYLSNAQGSLASGYHRLQEKPPQAMHHCL